MELGASHQEVKFTYSDIQRMWNTGRLTTKLKTRGLIFVFEDPGVELMIASLPTSYTVI